MKDEGSKDGGGDDTTTASNSLTNNSLSVANVTKI